MDELPDLSEKKAKADSAFAAHILAELKKLKPPELTHDEQLTLKTLRWQAGLDQEFAKYYWLEIQASAYSSVIPVVQRILDDQRFRNAGDLDHYVGLMDQLSGIHRRDPQDPARASTARHRPAQRRYSWRKSSFFCIPAGA